MKKSVKNAFLNGRKGRFYSVLAILLIIIIGLFLRAANLSHGETSGKAVIIYYMAGYFTYLLVAYILIFKVDGRAGYFFSVLSWCLTIALFVGWILLLTNLFHFPAHKTLAWFMLGGFALLLRFTIAALEISIGEKEIKKREQVS